MQVIKYQEQRTSPKEKSHVLYLIEDKTSGYDFFRHVMSALFPNSNSKFICCGNCTNLFAFLDHFIRTDTYSTKHFVDYLSDLDVHLKNLNAIVLIRDVCTTSNLLVQTVQLAKLVGLNIYATTYYCFEQCFCQYVLIDRHISKNQVYQTDYLWLQQCLEKYSYASTNSLFIREVNRFLAAARTYQLPSTFEQCISILYSCVYLQRECVRVSKHSYTWIATARGGVYKFFLDRCDFDAPGSTCFYLRHGQTPLCSIPQQMNFVALIDWYWKTALSNKLINLIDGSINMAIHDLEA